MVVLGLAVLRRFPGFAGIFFNRSLKIIMDFQGVLKDFLSYWFVL